MTENLANGLSSPKQFSSTDINAAMRFLYDTLERMQCLHDFVLLGETAKAVYEGKQIDAPAIEIGLKQSQITHEVKDWLWEFGFKEKDGGYETTFEYIPIRIKVIKRNYAFFKNPDTKFYDVDEYKIPNPFEKYWKARFIVQ